MFFAQATPAPSTNILYLYSESHSFIIELFLKYLSQKFKFANGFKYLKKFKTNFVLIFIHFIINHLKKLTFSQ